jgi:hypothetical protein
MSIRVKKALAWQGPFFVRVCVACVPIDGFFIPNPAHCFAGLAARISCYAAISRREFF